MEVILIGLLLVTAVVVNVPLGAWRRKLRRFSPAWFLAVHASIPALVAIRIALVGTNWVIPPEIGLAMIGQTLGGHLPALLPRADSTLKVRHQENNYTW